MRFSPSLILGLAFASVAAAQSPDAYAQNPYGADAETARAAAPSAPAASASPDEPAYELNPMAVVSKSPGRYARLTGTANRLDSNTLRRMRPLGTQEALERIAGVQGFADDGFGNSRLSIGIRGLPPRRSARVLILEDGIPIAPALYIYPLMYYNPPAERIDEIEVIKGAAALEYGPQTMGGVVNYITRRPRKEFGGLAQVVGGQHGYGSAYAEVGGWGTATLHPEVQLLYKRGDGYRQNNAFEQYNATFKLNWIATPKDAVYLKLNADVEDAQATYTGLTEYSFKENPDFNPKDHDTFDIQRYALDLIHTRDLGYGLRTTKLYGSVFSRDWWRENDIFVTAANWRAHRDSGAALVPVAAIDNPAPTNLVRVGNGETNYGNLRDFYTLGLDNGWRLYHGIGKVDGTLSLGARLHWERFMDRRKVGDAPDARDGVYFNPADSSIVGGRANYETMALSLYAAEELRFGPLTVTPGVRFEVFEQEQVDLLRGSRLKDHSEYVVLPGVGANYALNERANLFAGIHRGYTPPSTSTLAILNFGGVDDLDLRSEKSWNSELGARYADSWLGLELCGYHMYIQDMVAPATGTTFKNLGAIRTFGAEVSGTAAASKRSPFLPDARLAYTWLRSEVVRGEVNASQSTGGTVDISGNRLPYAPEHALVAALSRDFGFGLSLGAEAKYVSWVYTDFENLDFTENRGDIGPIDGYAVYDASAAYARGRYRVFLNAKNLFDNVYVSSRLHSNPYNKSADVQGILVGPRRQVNLGASVAF
jgi:Fe(3+) dicitrate transport protein